MRDGIDLAERMGSLHRTASELAASPGILAGPMSIHSLIVATFRAGVAVCFLLASYTTRAAEIISGHAL